MKSKLYPDSFKGTKVETIMKVFHEAKNGTVKLPRNAFMSDEKPQTFNERIRFTYDPAKPYSSLEFNMIQNWFLDSLNVSLNQWAQKYDIIFANKLHTTERPQVKNIVYWSENPMMGAIDGVRVDFIVNAIIPIQVIRKAKGGYKRPGSKEYSVILPVQIRGRMADYEAESKGMTIHKQKVRWLNMSLISYGVANHRDLVFGLAGGGLNA